MSDLYNSIGHELELGKLLDIEVIQSLWSDYGQLVRLKFSKKNIIVKHIELPKTSEHPKGWNTSLSHQRKLNSYQIEVNWYESFTKQIDSNFPMAKGLKTFYTKSETLIVMEDLTQLGFTNTTKTATKEHIEVCVKWLANFHARFLGVKSELLWEEGTYWHLDTRPDELEALEDLELKNYAYIIDKKLKECKFQTIVHGDAKLANFCFSQDLKACAAVDFQYVGHGCGMKDLVLFISSAVDPKDCAMMEKWILNTYFDSLSSALKYYHPNIDEKEVIKEYEDMFIIAWADFQRFIKGWSPNHFKINPYTESLKEKALEYLKEIK